MALTVRPVQGLKAGHVLITVCVWMVSMALVCVNATLALMAQPARTANLANMASIVIKVSMDPTSVIITLLVFVLDDNCFLSPVCLFPCLSNLIL